MSRTLKRLATIVTCAIALTGVARAGSVTVYDNLMAATNAFYPITNQDLGPLADSFSSGPGGTLSDVQLNLVRQGIATGQVTAYLYSDSHTIRTTPVANLYTIGTVPDSAVSYAPGSIVDFSGLNYTLAANTRYWILLTDNSPPNPATMLAWNWSKDTSGTGVAAEYFYSPEFGTTRPNSEGPFQMKVTLSSSVPEPPSIVLLGAGVVGCVAFVVRSRFRRRAAAAPPRNRPCRWGCQLRSPGEHSRWCPCSRIGPGEPQCRCRRRLRPSCHYAMTVPSCRAAPTRESPGELRP
jgi:hypothetical protein